MTAQIGYDAIAPNVHRITGHTPFTIGGYLNGAIKSYIWTRAQWALFQHSYHIRINVTGELRVGNMLDVERGDATPAHIVPWAESQISATPDPLLVYCSRNVLDQCVAERGKVKGWQGRIFMHVATLDGTIVWDRAMTQFGQLRDAAGVYADVSQVLNEQLIAAMAARIGKQPLVSTVPGQAP
jgi:hypothetical protein